MIKSSKSRFVNKIFSLYITRLLYKHFYRIHICGEENIYSLNNGFPTILYANHSNWWDGFVAYFLSSKRWKQDDYLMMDIEQMKKYPFFKYLGVFSVDRANPRDSMNTINYTVSLLKETNRFLWIFPQGLMHLQDHRPIEFFSGITSLAEKIGSVNLQPVAIRYEFILEQRPEIFIRLGNADIINNSHLINKDFTVYLRDKLIKELDTLKDDVVSNNYKDYSIVFWGKESRNKTIDRITPN